LSSIIGAAFYILWTRFTLPTTFFLYLLYKICYSGCKKVSNLFPVDACICHNSPIQEIPLCKQRSPDRG
ncbi:MAG TPA: hypothetical protein PKZ54_11120, partial [Syntrophorhabdaceae bacterium]|nr:hypothetical protein [Syntrophorhabdaceae bacterium]